MRPLDPRIYRVFLNWTPDRRHQFEERAAIMEYDGNMHRAVAEREAFEELHKE